LAPAARFARAARLPLLPLCALRALRISLAKGCLVIRAASSSGDARLGSPFETRESTLQAAGTGRVVEDPPVILPGLHVCMSPGPAAARKRASTPRRSHFCSNKPLSTRHSPKVFDVNQHTTMTMLAMYVVFDASDQGLAHMSRTVVFGPPPLVCGPWKVSSTSPFLYPLQVIPPCKTIQILFLRILNCFNLCFSISRQAQSKSRLVQVSFRSSRERTRLAF